MNIGLIDVDGHSFPNLALMKLSVWRKLRGDTVSWYSGIEHYNRIYISKVFSLSPGDGKVIQADEVMKGSSGCRLFDQWLPGEVEHIYPDYSLYPMCKEAYGFLTRGCVNKCPLCIAPRGEGLMHENADITELLDDRNSAIPMDNNVIVSEWGLRQIEKIINLKVEMDSSRGIDCRIIVKDKPMTALLARVLWVHYIRVAYNNSVITEEVGTTIAYLKETRIQPYRMFSYMLVKDGQVKDVGKRALLLDSLGCMPFAMAYRDLNENQPPTIE